MHARTLPASLTVLFAFAAPLLPAADAPREEVVVLSEFRVDTTRDRGYVATNATTGTRLNVAIKDLPLPIEVITREFIEDIGAFDIKEALDYSAGIVQETVTTSNKFTFSPSGSGNAGSVTRDTPGFTVRGLNTRSFLRSGFRQDTVTDNINVDRTSTLFIDPATGATVPSATAGAQRISVPERVVRSFDPISFRFTASTGF